PPSWSPSGRQQPTSGSSTPSNAGSNVKPTQIGNTSPASHAGGEPSPTRTATPARTRHPPNPPPEPDPKPGRARPHLPRTPTFGAFSRPEAPPTRHDGQLSTSEQQKTRLPADLRPGNGYFVSSSATFSLALVGRQLTKIADLGERRPSGVADYTDSARKLQPDSSSWWTGLPAGLSCPESWHERRTSGLVQGLLRASPNRVPERRVRVELRRVWRLLRRLRTLLGREPHSRISIQAPRSRR